jgi:prepilin-type N-terminal cleavage/methylation domain-containing protein
LIEEAYNEVDVSYYAGDHRMVNQCAKSRLRKAIPRVLEHGYGFTLIELLVVIAIISLLVSILLPSLVKAKVLAADVACMSNLKKIGLATYLYAEDNQEILPSYTYTYLTYSSYTNQFITYMDLGTDRDEIGKLWDCPLLDNDHFGVIGSNFADGVRSAYAYNIQCGNWSSSWGIPDNVRYLSRITHQDQTFMWSESQEDPYTGKGPAPLLRPSIRWDGAQDPDYFYHPDRRHHGGSPVLCIDNHAEWLAQEDMQDYWENYNVRQE